MVSDTFYFIVDDIVFCPKDDKPYCPLTYGLFELGVSFVALNYINLSLMQIHTVFYFNYIIYSGLLVFCCQNVATFLLYQSFQN